MTEVGIYLDARQVWIVMAAPFASSAEVIGEAPGQRALDLVNLGVAFAVNPRSEMGVYWTQAFGAPR